VQVQRNGSTSNAVFEGGYQERERGMGGGPNQSGVWEEVTVEGEKRERRRKSWNCVTNQYYISRRNCSNF
jgi:hypothetical protein